MPRNARPRRAWPPARNPALANSSSRMGQSPANSDFRRGPSWPPQIVQRCTLGGVTQRIFGISHTARRSGGRHPVLRRPARLMHQAQDLRRLEPAADRQAVLDRENADGTCPAELAVFVLPIGIEGAGAARRLARIPWRMGSVAGSRVMDQNDLRLQINLVVLSIITYQEDAYWAGFDLGTYHLRRLTIGIRCYVSRRPVSRIKRMMPFSES